ncbi:hypothetical protein [Reinekea sp. G2M2-21]|uniref:hypothetical protein n=1 Tax=Reinekea sp. G2M2-21 TaxID=2788942 RepID=UPI0018AC4B9C|nr:hypothetical protein [Reinekea sp. G2M2-21]
MTAAHNTQQANNDLVWSLENFNQRDLAKNFVTRFESRLCVYSPSVEQVYTNYTINFPNSENGKMVVLPNPYAFHDTFHNVTSNAVRDTGLFIVPGALIGKSGLFVIVKYKNQTVKPVPLPIRLALKKMVRTGDDSDPFLPILIKGDLREFDSNTPCLHLHRIKLSELHTRSDFEKQNIKNAIFDKMSDLYRDADEIAAGI